MIVKEQEEMKYYNDDRSDVSSPTSPTSPVEKVPLGRLGSGLFSSIQRDSEERGITSPITKKPLFTLNDVQEVDTSNDIGPPGSLVSEDKPWYETGSSEQLPKSVAATAAAAAVTTTTKQTHSNYKNASKASLNYRKREHIYESIDDVLAELRQNQGASPNYATLHKWTTQLTTPGSTSSSSSGSAALDTKLSSSQVSSRSSDDHDFTTRPTGDRDSTGNVSTTVIGERRHSKSSSSRPNSAAKERKYSTSNMKMSMQDGSHTPPPLVPVNAAAAAVTNNQPLSNDITTTTTTTTTTTAHVRKQKKLSFPDVAVPNAPPPSSQAKHSRQTSGPEVPSVAPDIMVRSQSARWVRQRTHQPGCSQSPTTASPSKDGYYTPQLPRSVQNGVQQSPSAKYSQNDEYNPLAEENSISLNFSNEVLSMFNFQQQSCPPPPPTNEKHMSRTASSSSTSTHGRRSVPLKPSPSPDLCVNPLGGPRISPPLDDNQPSTFCHVPRRQSTNANVPNYKSTGDAVLPKLSAKRSISSGGSQNNLLNDLPADYHPAAVQHRNNSIPSYHNMPSPNMLSSDVTKRDIVDCTSSPRFPRRSLTRSPGQTAVFKGANPQGSQPRIAKFTAPPPPTVAPPPKLHQQYPSSDFRPPMGGHVRPPAKVEQTWC